MRISVVIPVFREEALIAGMLAHVAETAEGDHEIIVVDGSPDGSTLSRIQGKQAITFVSGRGRGRQMNAGAAAASGEILLFLHADTRLPRRAFGLVRQSLVGNGAAGGAFRLGFQDENPFLRMVAFWANLRSAVLRLPFGDQAIFIRKDYFNEIGGYREEPLMEDLELMKRIRTRGGSIVILGDRVITSARKWEREGLLATSFRNWFRRIRYRFGADPGVLVEGYYRDWEEHGYKR